jgi:hypothetical protein
MKQNIKTMKTSFKILGIAAAIFLSTTACNNSGSGSGSAEGEANSDTTNGVVDSMPEDNSASGDTAVVVDSAQ